MMQCVTRFPSRSYAFVWRMWDLVPARRIAAFLGAPVAEVRAMAAELGLGSQPDNLEALRLRMRSLIIRRNWHCLPIGQVAALVDMDEAQLAMFMRYDDFLNHKVPDKPRCAPLVHASPTLAQRRAAQRLGAQVAAMPEPAHPEQAFDFLNTLRAGRAGVLPPPLPKSQKWAVAPRIMHPFDAPHNPAAFEPENTPVPYLRLMRDFGADSLWFGGVVFDLIELPGYPEFGQGRRLLLPKLRSLIDRADKAGIGIYLYICEPRSQPAAFFTGRPELDGAPSKSDPNIHHVCTSSPAGQALVRDSIREVCRALPGLAGLISISASEYPSNCWSHGGGDACPRCGQRRPADVLNEMLGLMRQGMDEADRNMDLIAWNWGWQWAMSNLPGEKSNDKMMDRRNDAREYLFKTMPRRVTPLLNFEYGTLVKRGGHEMRVWEYAMSQPCEGPLTRSQKRAIDETGRPALARIHISNSTEYLGTPYVPVMQLVAEKIMDLRDKGYKGYMGSWIFGGYPSPNAFVARELCRAGKPDPDKVLLDAAALYYGPENAETVVKAWAVFSRAFRLYPFSIAFQYSAPLHVAPAIEWPLEPSGFHSKMFYPSDTPERYCTHFTMPVVLDTFGKIAAGWKKGLDILRQALDNTRPAFRAEAQRDYDNAEVFWLCCQSLAGHIQFCQKRLEYKASAAARSELRALIEKEMDIARRYYAIARADSRVGFEASMQYFTLPHDVREKMLGLRQALDTLDRLDSAAKKGGSRA